MAKANFDPSQNQNPWADCNKIPHNWLCPREVTKRWYYSAAHWNLISGDHHLIIRSWSSKSETQLNIPGNHNSGSCSYATAVTDDHNSWIKWWNAIGLNFLTSNLIIRVSMHTAGRMRYSVTETMLWNIVNFSIICPLEGHTIRQGHTIGMLNPNRCYHLRYHHIVTIL